MKIKVPQKEMICNLRYVNSCDIIYSYTGWVDKRNIKIIVNNNFLKELNLIKQNIITVYCKWDHLNNFFKVCGRIDKKIILISGCSDGCINKNMFVSKPGNIVKWYGENINYKHPDLISLPMGSLSTTWIGNEKDKTEISNHRDFKLVSLNDNEPKIKNLCFMCFTLDTNRGHRKKVYDYFGEKKWVTNLCKEKTGQYLNDDIFMDNVYNHHFVISPFGNGIDCGRTWMTLQLGSVPILPYHIAFEDWEKNLPIILFKNISEITEEFLLEKLKEFKNRNYNYDYLKTSYWKNRWENEKKIYNKVLNKNE